MHKFPVSQFFFVFVVIELRKGKGGGRNSREEILNSSLRHRSWTTMSAAGSIYFPPRVSHILQNVNSRMAFITGFCIAATRSDT